VLTQNVPFRADQQHKTGVVKIIYNFNQACSEAWDEAGSDLQDTPIIYKLTQQITTVMELVRTLL
jgi:hypothetical protein